MDRSGVVEVLGATEGFGPKVSPQLFSHDVIIVVGSGGVGKTTTSAALALLACSQGKKVLCLTIDPAKRLANSLGLGSISNEAVTLSGEHTKDCFVSEGTLTVMMLDSKKTFDELVMMHAPNPESAQRILDNRMYQVLSTSLSGTREYMSMEKLYELKTSKMYDLIVLDTPPSSNAIDFLDAPDKFSSLVNSPSMKWLAGVMQVSSQQPSWYPFSKLKQAGTKVLEKGAGMVVKAVSQFTGQLFLESLSEMIMVLGKLFDGFEARAQVMKRELSGTGVAYVLVGAPSLSRKRECDHWKTVFEHRSLNWQATLLNGVQDKVDVPMLSKPDLDVFEDWNKQSDLSTRAVEAFAETHGMHPMCLIPKMSEEVNHIAPLWKVACGIQQQLQ